MEWIYAVYGLQVLADAPIPGLFPLSAADRIDVRIWVNRMPSWWDDRLATPEAVRYTSRMLDQHGKPLLTMWKVNEDWYYQRYSGLQFLIEQQGREVWCAWPPGFAAENQAPHLYGPVLGFVMRLRGVCCLHASAVRIGDTVIAFSGPSLAGKSTTAAAFGKLGYAVLSDDITALLEKDQEFLVQSGYSRLCLWPDAAESLFGASEPLPRIIPGDGLSVTSEKRYLDLTSSGYFQTESLPLSAVYLLDERVEGASHPVIEAVPANTALMKLVANTYAGRLLDQSLRSQEFHFLGRLLARVPVRRVVPQDDAQSLPKLCEAILQDHRALPALSGPAR